jgi:predicted metalloendopeptidase
MIGFLLAHEMAHNFDHYKHRLMKAEAPHSRSFTEEQMPEQFQPGLEAQFQVFQDLIAIPAAYDAFEQAMRGRPRPRLEGFTPEQRFFLGLAQFIGFAQGWTDKEL